MSKLIFSQKQILDFLNHFGFVKKGKQEGSHQTYSAVINGITRNVTVDVKYSTYSDTVLKYMIRQSGIDKKVFWKYKKSGVLPSLSDVFPPEKDNKKDKKSK